MIEQTGKHFGYIPQWKLMLRFVVKAALIGLAAAVYISCFNWQWFFCAIMVILFMYSFGGTADRIVNFLSYFLIKPVILKEVDGVVENGIPKGMNIVFFHPIFASGKSEMEGLFRSLKQEIVNNQEPADNMKFIVIDDSKDDEVKGYARSGIKELQKEFGDNVVFYFHRNPRSKFFGKAGCYQDALMLLYEGWTRPHHYTDAKWDTWTQGTRNPQLPVFDEIIGDVLVLGINGTPEDIVKGRDVTIINEKRAEISIVCDADNVWPEGQVRKLVAKILHPDNRDIVIFQPRVEISNIDENDYVRLEVKARDMMKYDVTGKWKFFRFQPFYGKGAMRIGSYIRDIIKTERIHPGKAASHDFQESLHAWTVFLEDVWILEKAFPNKIAELLRGAQWQWGDIETLKQFLFRKFSPGRNAHVYALLRWVVREPVLLLWLIGTVLSLEVTGLAVLVKPELFVWLIAAIMFFFVGIFGFFTPMVSEIFYRRYRVGGGNRLDKSLLTIVGEGILETAAFNLVHKLDMIYKSKGVLQNLIKQVLGERFVWKTGETGEIETANMSLYQVYRSIPLTTLLGVGLLVGGYAGIFSSLSMFLMSPFIASFIFGPALIRFTSTLHEK